MCGLIDKALLEELLKRGHVEIIYDLGEHTEGISLKHLVLVLAHIFSELGDNDEDLALLGLELLNEDVHESPEALGLRGVDLEELGHIEEHTRFLTRRKFLAL